MVLHRFIYIYHRHHPHQDLGPMICVANETAWRLGCSVCRAMKDQLKEFSA